MSLRVIERDWKREITNALHPRQQLMLICPFVQLKAIKTFLEHTPRKPRLITRLNDLDFYNRVSDYAALRHWLKVGGEIRSIKHLHTKMYLFEMDAVIIGSANITKQAFTRNFELGVLSRDPAVIADCRCYFEDLWSQGLDITFDLIRESQAAVAGAGNPLGKSKLKGLKDRGRKAKLRENSVGKQSSPTPQSFIKIFGTAENRMEVIDSVEEEIYNSTSDKTCTFSKNIHLTVFKDGDIIYMTRMMKEGNYRIYGRAIAKRHNPKTDFASQAEKAANSWRRRWCKYLRVYNAEFIAGNLGNSISFKDMERALGAKCFPSTELHEKEGRENTEPSRSLMRKSYMQLTETASQWLEKMFDKALKKYGRIDAADVDTNPAKGLSRDAQNIFQLLIRRITSPTFQVGNFATYYGYGEILHELRIEFVHAGGRFRQRGGEELCDWLHERKTPALTGIVISKSGDNRNEPGDRFFEKYGKGGNPDRFEWWREQVASSQAKNWDQYLAR